MRTNPPGGGTNMERQRYATAFDRTTAAACVAFLALSLAWTWPVPARLNSHLPSNSPDAVLITWLLWWNTQALPFSAAWWDAPFFHPLRGALALSEHLFGMALFTVPLQWAGLKPVGAYNIAFILTGWLSGFFAFLLARRLTGSIAAAFVGGAAFAFAPYRASQLAHLQVLNAQWMPLILLAMHGYLEDRRVRWLVLFAVAWLLQALSNGYFLLFFPLLVAAWIMWFVRPTDLRAGAAIVATFAGSSLLLLPALLRYREVHNAFGLTRDLQQVLLFSGEPAAFLRMHHLLSAWPYIPSRTQEDLLYPGLTVVGLVCLSAVRRDVFTRARTAIRRRSPLLFYVLATLLMWWLALGPAADPDGAGALTRPYTWLASLPGFSSLRAPARFAMPATLTLAMAAALAFVRVRTARPVLRAIFTTIVAVGLCVDGWVEPLPLTSPPATLTLPDLHDSVVVELPLNEDRVAVAAMFRMIQHRRPLVNGYSGHTPPHYRALSEELINGDTSGLLRIAESNPVVVIVNTEYDKEGRWEQLARSLPGVSEQPSSAAGRVFLLPAQRGPAGTGGIVPRMNAPLAGTTARGVHEPENRVKTGILRSLCLTELSPPFVCL